MRQAAGRLRDPASPLGKGGTGHSSPLHSPRYAVPSYAMCNATLRLALRGPDASPWSAAGGGAAAVLDRAAAATCTVSGRACRQAHFPLGALYKLLLSVASRLGPTRRAAAGRSRLTPCRVASIGTSY